jgi:hypothetical protein
LCITIDIINSFSSYIIVYYYNFLIDTYIYYLITNYSGLTGNYAILCDTYIAPALAKYAYYESLFQITYKVENTGVFKRNTDTAQSISVQEFNLITSKIKNDAEFYANKITNYLIANRTLFPEYQNPGTSSDTVIPTIRTFKSNIVFANPTEYNKYFKFMR